MRVAQISLTYLPILGGQEVYIDELNKVIESIGGQWHVFQRSNGVVNGNITSVSHPQFLRPVMGFNIGLIKHALELRKFDKLIVHYPDHFPTVAWHPGSIVLTHGVNWELDPERKRKRRVQLAEYSLKRAKQFVANDTHFYRTMGWDVKAGEQYFSEVAPNRWFIPNCVNTVQFKKTNPHPALKGKKVVVVPRNITPARGVDLAVEAFALFLKSSPDSILTVVGQPLNNQESKDYYEKIKNRIEQLGIKEKVMFLGSVPHQLMPSVYSEAQMTLIPTRANEGTALSALESMSCQTPTITTAVAGLKDLPSLQTDPTPESIAAAMKEVLSSSTNLSQLQHSAVLKTFNLQNWSEAWGKVIRANLRK